MSAQIGGPAAAAGPFRIEPIGPALEGGLQLRVTCRTARTGGPRTTHRVSIEADWSVRTPHDLGLERIASAMGRYLSCLEFVDQVVPALRELVQLRARRVLPQFTRTIAGRWSLRSIAAGCECRPDGFASAAEAAEHGRDPAHMARLRGTESRPVRRLLELVEHAHRTRFQLPPPDAQIAARAAARVVKERDGVQALWAAGVHPQMLVELHAALWPGGPPLPMWFYLGAVSRRPDVRWVAETLAAVPDEDVAVWLCWTAGALDASHPEARTAWLGAGVSRHSITALVDGGYVPFDVARLVARTRRSVPSAASTFAAWHRAGCHPSPEDIAMIDALGADPWVEPSIGAIDWLLNYGEGAAGLTRTELGLLLAVCGTRRSVLSVLDKGIRDPWAAARVMFGEPPAQLAIDAMTPGYGMAAVP